MRLIDVNNLFNNRILVVSNSASLEVIEKIMDMIKEAPTIDAEPVRHGKWTRDYESSWGDSRFMCSVCHCKESVPTCNGEPSIWDYCPNCGAKMDEVNDGNDKNATK